MENHATFSIAVHTSERIYTDKVTPHCECYVVLLQVYRYVFDSTLTGKRQRVVADFIVYYGLANAALRDEIYVQLCNLTFLSSVSAADSDRATVRRTWQLMAHCLSSFKPSNTLHNYLLKSVARLAACELMREARQAQKKRNTLFTVK